LFQKLFAPFKKIPYLPIKGVWRAILHPSKVLTYAVEVMLFELQIEGLKSPPLLPHTLSPLPATQIEIKKIKRKIYTCFLVFSDFLSLRFWLYCFCLFVCLFFLQVLIILELNTILAKLNYFLIHQMRPDDFWGRILSDHFKKQFCQKIATAT